MDNGAAALQGHLEGQKRGHTQTMIVSGDIKLGGALGIPDPSNYITAQGFFDSLKSTLAAFGFQLGGHILLPVLGGR